MQVSAASEYRKFSQRSALACEAVVERGNFLKFGQNEEMKQILLGTGSKQLVEASPNDRICLSRL